MNKKLGLETDHLIIGAGIAGLQLALHLRHYGNVMVVTKSDIIDSNTWYAQGGIASVLNEDDSFGDHVSDTIEAGAGLCKSSIVEKVVRIGPEAISELIEYGVAFTKEKAGDQTYHLTKEGGHSKRRVIHAKDLTGREVLRGLAARVDSCPNIKVLENQFAVDLLTTDRHAPDFAENRCLGAYFYDRDSQNIYPIRAKRTFIATGGHGKAYQYTSNPDSATGDGLAMAWRAGCRIANLEFMQFHPTCLFHPKAKSFLITEALRGEGAVIRNESGDDFIKAHHPLGSLAPRDIVARAIDSELKSSGRSHVWLDARALGRQRLVDHFPNIFERCQFYGIDISSEMIPIVPAAHYSCGGVVVDEGGATNIKGLYALGEVACTGLHGANRLASNSLLEALAFAKFVADRVALEEPYQASEIHLPDWDDYDAVASDEMVVLSHTWDEIRRLMWNYVGIVRTTRRLERALHRVRSIRGELNRYYWNYRLSDGFLEVRNLADVAYLTIRCAMSRKESRGIHYTTDFPESRSSGRDTILSH